MNEKKYTKDHEWISCNENIGTVGITNHAQESLGDIVFIDLPEINKEVKAGSEISVIESVKAASDIFSPVEGKIIEINNKLIDNAAIINSDAENEGWIFKIQIKDLKKINELMNLEEYQEFLKQS